MNSQPILLWLYLANAAVLILHQIDAAYWHEWDLFGMPGGIQLNLLLNVPLILLVLFGQQRLAQGRPTGYVFSWVLVGGGVLAVSLHSYFLWQGDPAFRLPVSLGVLGVIFVLSVSQAIALLKLTNPSPKSAPGK